MGEAEATARAKALGQDQAWCLGGAARRPRLLEQSKGGGRGSGEGREGAGLLPPGRKASWRAEGRGQAGPDSGAHRCPLLGKTDCGGDEGRGLAFTCHGCSHGSVKGPVGC